MADVLRRHHMGLLRVSALRADVPSWRSTGREFPVMIALLVSRDGQILSYQIEQSSDKAAEWAGDTL